MTVTEQPPTEDIAPEAPAVQYWSGPLVIEDAATGDRRRVMPDALTWRDLPLPLMFQDSTPQGGMGGNPHAGAALAGRITHLWRDGPTVYGAGPLAPSGAGVDLAAHLADGPLGVSVDMDDTDSEMVCNETDETGECLDGELQITKARIMGATACPFPAIPDAMIALTSEQDYLAMTHGAQMADITPVDETEPHAYVDDGEGLCKVCGKPEDAPVHDTADEAPPRGGPDSSVVASGGLLPSEEWFQDPELERLTPFTICDPDETGWRPAFGHLAAKGQCHISFPDSCVTPPASQAAYRYFTTGAVRAACCCGTEGEAEIPVGTLTLGTTHAPRRMSAAQADTHYEKTGYAVAMLAAGEDEHGIWVAGAVPPSVPESRVRELRGASLSGDWRRVAGNLELVAILAVNVPGFPVPRTGFHTSDGKQLSLVAAGVLPSAGLAPHAQLETLAQRLSTAEAILASQTAVIDQLRPLALAGLVERLGLDRLATKTEDGQAFPKSDYAYTPSDEPSTWKLRLTKTPGGSPDPGIVGAAAAALGPGFRGSKVSIPSAALAGVKAKVRAAWKTANPGKQADEMPKGIAP